jgi:hemerythrin-like metal-binding protein
VTPIAWREEYSVGLPDVDHEHRMLIAMINEAAGSLRPEVPRARIVASLGEICARIAAHFALEEREMRSLGYAGLAEHKHDHERLLEDILDIMADVESARGYDPARLEQRLSDWFTDHFRTHDASLHHWLAARG